MESLCAVPAILELQWVQITPQGLRIGLRSVAVGSRCPSCGQESGRVHSYYRRTLADLPAQGRAVQLCIGLRRFFCDRDDCPRQTFAEQVPELMARHCPRTGRLGMQLREIGLAAGGEAGSRLAKKLAMPASADTLLRLIRRTPVPPAPTPRVLGVDDWALARGQEYGTLLCDLETHRPIDLLADRSAEVLAQWLVEHPGVQIISRDRGGEYARGASQGAPQAIQVADRFHLVHNLIQAFEKALGREHALLAQAAQMAALATAPAAVAAPSPGPPPPAAAKLNARQQRRAGHTRQWQELFAQVKALRAQGLSLRKIAGQLKLGLHTVCRFVHTDSFPARAGNPPLASPVDAFMPYLQQRWEQGCRNSRQLYRELKDKGFGGSRHMVYRRLAAWRNARDTAPQTTEPAPAAPAPDACPPEVITDPGASLGPAATGPRQASSGVSWRRPSARSVVWMLLHRDSKHASCENSPRSIQRRALVAALHQIWPQLAQNLWLVEEFSQVLRQREPANLEAWMGLIEEPDVVVELKNFARHLRQDWAAVVQAVCQPWSNGQVEGQVNRLKLIKRLMYGRANIDLLKVRVLEMN
jgi:transposase